MKKLGNNLIKITSISLFCLSVFILSSCDKHRNDSSNEVTVVDMNVPVVEKFARKGIEISEEERKTIFKTITQEGILHDE